ncbi:MAG: hypothetical protein PVH61_07775 [Candidatus Aminicenantes bacterium]|jgi:hypothetical protein
MRARQKPILIIMVIILVGQLLGEVKAAAGKLLIPTAEGKEKPYRGAITITRAEILIECQEKIFQLFNDSNAPKQAKIRIDTAEVERISLQGNGVIIFPKAPLCNRHRNLLIHVWLLSMMKQRERLVFIFVIDMDIYNNIDDNEIKVLDFINEHSDPKCEACGFIRFY